MALTFNQGEKSDRFRSEDGESFSGEKLSLEDNEAVGYHTQRFAISDRAQLIKEVKQLHKMINMFDKQAKRRKSQHMRAITGLKGELSKLK